MKTIYIIRHGQTLSNVHRITGRAIDPLSDLGKQQAQLAANRFKEIPIEAIISSPYLRAKETAQEVAAVKQLPIEFSDVFAECKSPSELEGLSGEDPKSVTVRKLLSENWGNEGWHYSDEENFYDVSARAQKALALLAARKEESLIVVSHGAFTKNIVEQILLRDLLTPDLSTALFYSMYLHNTGVTVIRLLDDATWQLVRWNDTVHLEPDSLSY